VLLLGILAAPNAVIAAASYLAGPGFALGSGSGVALGSTVHGTLPAFPILGAVPAGPATTPVWLLTAVTPIIGGLCLARVAAGTDSWRLRLRVVGLGALSAALLGLLLAWQGGGAIGSGRLHAFGASPWQFGAATGAALAVVAGATTAALGALAWWRGRGRIAEPRTTLRATLTSVIAKTGAAGGDEADEGNKLAG
jgi:hypothetical protein